MNTSLYLKWYMHEIFEKIKNVKYRLTFKKVSWTAVWTLGWDLHEHFAVPA